LEDPGSTGGGLDKEGDGTLTLAEANTYKGPTDVNDGTLLLNGNNSAATGAITVNNEGALGGTGTLGGAVTVTTDAKLAPGTSAGTLTTSANIGGAGTLDIELDGPAADKLVLPGSGTIEITGLKLNITQLAGGATEPVYIIVDSASAITGATFASVTGVPSGYTLTYNYNDGVDSNNIALVAAAGSPFTTWASTNGLAGGDATPGADPDNDGLDNAIEFVIGGQPNPANPNATATASGANLVFTFRRTDLSLTQPGIVIHVEYGSNLVGWTPAQDGVNGVTVTPSNDVPEPGIDTVVVSIPKALATGEKLFARLNVTIP
jgi:autotransporter-associated beta strand protein